MFDSIDNVDRTWDVIVIGTGIGGATLGHALAKAGNSVLFCEKGKATPMAPGTARGRYAETFIPRTSSAMSRVELMKGAGRYVDDIVDLSGTKPWRFVPFIGSGSGGSSALYGMVLERFKPSDFIPRAHHPNATDASLPEHWPVGYAELEPYYRDAEALYRVDTRQDEAVTTPAPLRIRRAPPLSASADEMTSFLSGKGLHPYRLPLACDFVDRCAGCQGFLCAQPCKNDSAKVCLDPALRDHGAVLMDECEVLRILADARRVDGIVCRWRGKEHTLHAQTVVLAAGALATPALLLRSANEHWPAGLANGSGLVGKNLMRHCVDLYAVFSRRRPAPDGNAKEVGLNDFYISDAGKFGSIQSFGRMPPGRVVADDLHRELGRHGRAVSRAFALVKPMVGAVLDAIFSRTVIFASTLEDLPYEHNRVGIDAPDGGRSMTIRYRLHRHETDRIARFRAIVGRAFAPYRFLLLKQAENNERLAHVCGTCRFGDNPATSVLDRNNRAHGLENLYVVDASFFPTSGGTNPALTIAANALRVARHMTARS